MTETRINEPGQAAEPAQTAGPAATTETAPTVDPAPTAEAAPPVEQKPRYWRPATRHNIATAGIILVALAAILILLRAWQLPPFGGAEETTENAYVRGRTTSIAPQVSGYVVQVLVHDYQQVKRGQVLVRIDDRIYRARVAQAAANLDAQLAALANSKQAHASRTAGLQSQTAGLAGARAQLLRARADLARIDDLVSDGSVSRRERDQAVAALAQAEAGVRQSVASGEIARQDIRTVDVGRGGLEAQVEAARAQLRLTEIDLGNTVIRAPEDGQLGEIGVRLGQYVTNGNQLLALVPPDRWIIANYKEAQTAGMRPGQPATFTVDALGGAKLQGHVEQLSPAAGSEFAVLKPDNATGNFVKVPQRIGVRVSVDPGQSQAVRLRPGMSVELHIDTRKKS
ncbi:HlyD family secretion protein [Sphingomonas sp. JC676]|uniref:HlyD family secretion protein n=1 Tax=Sphingomonas sp. JC676 TaxID=2768065 RepID=UPI0016576BA3|nr:HlyD family secretion protein [Sphingomonas sp. JC676]MBC9032303.1 HlyD family secretion protein [Sphingomonas sp. JC676]